MDIVHYHKAYDLYVYFDSRTQEVFRMTGPVPLGRHTFGRIAVIQRLNESNPYYTISYAAPYYNIPAPMHDQTLFVSSESKIPRDLIRNSGYKITRDINNADYVIIPKPECTTGSQANLFFLTQDEDFYQVFIYDKAVNERRTNYSFDELEIIKTAIGLKYGNGTFYAYATPQLCYFIRNVKEYEDILKRQTSGRCHVLDTNLKLNPSTNISPENLHIMSKMDDEKAVLKLLMSSDFTRYPLTLCNFLFNDLDVDYGYGYGDQANWFMKTIGYDEFYASGGERYLKMVTPEDLKMLQDFILYKLNLTGPGLVTEDTFKDDKMNGYRQLIGYRVAIKPYKIDEPVDFQTLNSLIKNNN